jgi:hypothetical protein
MHHHVKLRTLKPEVRLCLRNQPRMMPNLRKSGKRGLSENVKNKLGEKRPRLTGILDGVEGISAKREPSRSS